MGRSDSLNGLGVSVNDRPQRLRQGGEEIKGRKRGEDDDSIGVPVVQCSQESLESPDGGSQGLQVFRVIRSQGHQNNVRRTVECGSEKTTQNVLGRGTAFTDGTPRHPTLSFLMECAREKLRGQTVEWVSDTDTSNGGIAQSHNLER